MNVAKSFLEPDMGKQRQFTSVRRAAANVCLGALLTLLCAIGASADEYGLTWHRIASGGETFAVGSGASGDFALGGTIGQHEAGDISGGDGANQYVLHGGFWAGSTVEPSAPTCPGDLNGDGLVDVFDLLIVLSAWGACANPGNCPADLNGDGVVDVFDLLMLLSAWGACPS